MKRLLNLSVLLAGIMIMLYCGTALAKDVKIGVIDTQKIMRESKAAKKAGAAFLKDVEAKRAVYTSKEKEVQTLRSKLQKSSKKMSESARKQKGEKLQKEIKELKRLRTDLEEELKKKDVELGRKIRKEILGVVKAYMKKNDFTVILEKRSVVAADDAIDISDKIIKLYDATR